MVNLINVEKSLPKSMWAGGSLFIIKFVTNLTVLLELDECDIKVIRLLSHTVCKSLDLKRKFVYYSNIIATKYVNNDK